jgi:hypothetical protein
MEELKSFLPLMEQYLFELQKHRDKIEEVINKYFAVLPNELLGGKFVDLCLQEPSQYYDILLNVVKHRKEIIEKLNEENKEKFLIENEFLIPFIIL